MKGGRDERERKGGGWRDEGGGGVGEERLCI